MDKTYYYRHGGGVAPVWHIRLDQIAAISEVYGHHGMAVPGAPFGPFVDVMICGGQKVRLENCIEAYNDNLSTTETILRAMEEHR